MTVHYLPGSCTVSNMAAMSSSSFLASFTFLEASLALFWAWFAFSKAVKADAPSDAATPSFSPNRSLVSESLFVRELAASESSFESCLLSVASTLTVSATSEASLEMVSALRATVRARFAEVSAPLNYNYMSKYHIKAVCASELTSLLTCLSRDFTCIAVIASWVLA